MKLRIERNWTKHVATIDGFSGVCGIGETVPEAVSELRANLDRLERYGKKELDRIQTAKSALIESEHE